MHQLISDLVSVSSQGTHEDKTSLRAKSHPCTSPRHGRRGGIYKSNFTARCHANSYQLNDVEDRSTRLSSAAKRRLRHKKRLPKTLTSLWDQSSRQTLLNGATDKVYDLEQKSIMESDANQNTSLTAAFDLYVETEPSSKLEPTSMDLTQEHMYFTELSNVEYDNFL